MRPKRFSTMAVSLLILLLCFSTVHCSSCAVNGNVVAGETLLLQFTAIAKQGVLGLCDFVRRGVGSMAAAYRVRPPVHQSISRQTRV